MATSRGAVRAAIALLATTKTEADVRTVDANTMARTLLGRSSAPTPFAAIAGILRAKSRAIAVPFIVFTARLICIRSVRRSLLVPNFGQAYDGGVKLATSPIHFSLNA